MCTTGGNVAFVVGEVAGLDAKRSLLEGPVLPGRFDDHLTVDEDLRLFWKVEHAPEMRHPRSGTYDNVVTRDGAPVGDDRRDGPTPQFDVANLGLADDLNPFGQCFGSETIERRLIEGEATLVLVEHAGDSLGAPVVEHRLHVGVALFSAFDERRWVADCLLLLVDRPHVFVHALVRDLHVADWVIGVGLRVALPHRHGVSHQLAHRRLVVVVPDHSARNARGSGTDTALVDDEDVRAGPLASGSQLHRKVIRGGQPVDASPDDAVRDCFGEGNDVFVTHRLSVPCWRFPALEDWRLVVGADGSRFGYPWAELDLGELAVDVFQSDAVGVAVL